MEHVKCVTLGDGAVGKTALLRAFTQNAAPGEYIPTVFDNYALNMRLDGHLVNLSLWDTAGQEDYDRLRPLSYPGTDVFLLCFSLVSPVSMENVRRRWVPEIKASVPHAKIVLCGTKSDLCGDSDTQERLEAAGLLPVQSEEGRALAAEVGACAYCETSAVTHEGMQRTFEEVVRTGLWRGPKGSASRKKKPNPLVACLPMLSMVL